MSAEKRILVAGIGNIFFGDDAFGCEVLEELRRRGVPGEVEAVDFGIRSYDLAYALMDGYETAILVDAVPRGEPPGTLFLIEPDPVELENFSGEIDAHRMNPVSVLQMVKSLGGKTGRLYLVGCEPAVLECEEGEMGLSENVRAAVPGAVEMIESLLGKLLIERSDPSPIAARENDISICHSITNNHAS